MVTSFSIAFVISGGKKRLCAMEPCLGSGRVLRSDLLDFDMVFVMAGHKAINFSYFMA